MKALSKVPYDTFWHQNKEIINFGGTNYLGIAGHSKFNKYLNEGISKVGFSWGSSPVSPLQIAVYEEYEAILSSSLKAESATLVSSGMWAGQLVLQVLAKEYFNYSNIYAPYVHPALWGQDYRVKFKDFKDFEEKIFDEIKNSTNSVVNIFIDAVTTPIVKEINFNWLANVNEIGKKINLIVDESHSIGVLGNHGEGRIEEYNCYLNVNVIRIASLNKALGLPGGLILSNKAFKKQIVANSMYIGASRMSPAVAYAGILAQDLYQSQLEKLQENIIYFKSVFSQIFAKLETIINHPAMEVPCAINEHYMLKNELFMPIFSYPSSLDKPVARLVISAYHNHNQIDVLGNFLSKVI